MGQDKRNLFNSELLALREERDASIEQILGFEGQTRSGFARGRRQS